jgi:hypothetical protein
LLNIAKFVIDANSFLSGAAILIGNPAIQIYPVYFARRARALELNPVSPLGCYADSARFIADHEINIGLFMFDINRPNG